MLVLMRVMNSTNFLVLRDCCCGAVAVVGVVVVGVVVVGVVVLAAELIWDWVVVAGSPAAEMGGAGLACGGDVFGGTVCWGDWGDGLKPSFCKLVTSWIRRLLTWRRASTRC